MICVAWVGMGSYAQSAVAQLIRDSSEPVKLIAITADVPRICESELEGAKVVWVEQNDTRHIDEVLGEMPRVLIESGWFLPILRTYIRDVRKSGGHVIGMCDNPMMRGWRLFLWCMRFRLLHRRWYEGFVTAGESARRLLIAAGFPEDRISVGSYACDLSVFTNGGPICEREKKIVYVGRFIDIKNIRRFLSAYIRFAATHPEWSFDLYGQGPLQKELDDMIARSGVASITMHPFATPQELAEVYKRVRVLALPSYSDHWGVVVQEAAASGCAVLVSTEVRAADAFCSERNSFTIDPMSEDQMVKALEGFASWDDARWNDAQAESLVLAQRRTPKIFSDGVRNIIDKLR